MPKKQVWSDDGSLKRCSKCEGMKPPDDFHRRKLKSGGFGHYISWLTNPGRKDSART